MKTRHLLGLTGLASLGLLLLGAANPTPGEGEIAKHKFRKPLDNGRGISSLKELRGKPVLIDFWGTK